MKKTMLLVAIAFTFTSLAHACPSEKRAEVRKQRVAKLLDLTPEQQQQFKLVMQEKREQMHLAKTQIDSDTHQKLSAFLSQEQMEKVEKKNKHIRRLRRH